MAVRTLDLMFRGLNELRYHRTEKRIRAWLGDAPVVDTFKAVLVWEPKRISPSYAVPSADISAELMRSISSGAAAVEPTTVMGGPPVLTPEHRFAVHTAPGEVLDVAAGEQSAEGAAFRPEDPDLDGYVILDFDAFVWREEEDEIISHARDPFHRIDVRHSSRQVHVEAGGAVLAESSRPVLVFETGLPVRFYLPPEDVRTDLLASSPTQTTCAYKGRASYWSADLGNGPVDIAWFYPDPLPEAVELTGLIAFFDEHTDVTVDGVRRERPDTPWARRSSPS